MKLTYPEKATPDEIKDKTKASVLIEKERFGGDSSTMWYNRLILGENTQVLKSLLSNPEIKGQVRLVYIDPPFSTKRIFDQNDDLSKCNFLAYEDQLTGFEFVEFLRRRLILIKDLLAENWSIYVHIDQRMVHYIRVIMDEVFGERNFVNMISRKKCNSKGSTRNSFGNTQDYILFYSGGPQQIWNKPLLEMTEEIIKSSEYRYIEETTGRIYKKVPIHAPGIRNGETGKAWRGILPPTGKHWQFTPKALENFDVQGRIFWSSTGNPRLKVYLDEREGILAQDLWLNFLDPMNQHTSVTDYPTEKNQKMLEFIIKASSNENDLVLDCFCGSGTTMAAAETLGRRWIGIDSSKSAIDTSKKRLFGGFSKAKVISSQRPFIVSHAV